jgi:hypothetical protein
MVMRMNGLRASGQATAQLLPLLQVQLLPHQDTRAQHQDMQGVQQDTQQQDTKQQDTLLHFMTGLS